MESYGNGIEDFEITRIENGEVRTVRDSVVTEFSLMLYIGGRHLVNLLCSSGDLDALVYGYLFTERIIRRKSELISLTIRGDVAESELTVEPDFGIVCTITSGLGPQRTFAYHSMQVSDIRLADNFYLPLDELLDNLRAFNTESALFTATGGVHSCALHNRNGKRIFMEDIGRHNAFDKVLGRALMEDWEISQSYLLTSGRVPGYMVVKALHAGLPIVVSRSAPTDMAVKLARNGNMTLCGFARGRRMNIYSAPQRILTGCGV